MVYKTIEGRQEVIDEARNQIDALVSEIEYMIRGAKSEYLFHIVYIFLNLFASLGKRHQTDVYHSVFNITWLRAATGFTLALNKILPTFLPLKPLTRLNAQEFEKTFDEGNLFHLLDICYRIGVCYYLSISEYVDEIAIEDGDIKPFPPTNKAKLFQEYVDKASVSKEQLCWLEWFYQKLGSDYEVMEMLNSSLKDRHGFTLSDLRNASMYLEGLTKDNKIMPTRDDIWTVFTRNMNNYSAERLLEALTFGSGKDLCKSPLVPLEENYFLIAGWVFNLGLHFDSWIMPMLEQKRSYLYSSFIGRAFEEYVEGGIRPVADRVWPKVEISEHKYPGIRPWLEKLGKKERFEIDFIVSKGRFALIISCKGGKKELPKSRISRMWGEFPERELSARAIDNKREMKEIHVEANCIASNREILRDFGIEGKEILPVAVYSTVQPLSIPKLRGLYRAPSTVMVATLSELKKFLESLS